MLLKQLYHLKLAKELKNNAAISETVTTNAIYTVATKLIFF